MAARRRPSAHGGPVLVVWQDAQIDTDFDGDPEDAPGTVELQAIGFLVRDDRREIVLAMDRDPATGMVRFVFSIPKKMVKSIARLAPAAENPESATA